MSWERVRGHERLIEVFDRAVQHGRLAHAYLFVGPEGVGKKLFATELARALLCETREAGSPLEPCGQCLSCRMIDAGSHPDFYVVGRPEEKNEFPVEVMRELCRNFSLKSARGRGKVAIVDDADDLNPESANCFLKTLEEPPAFSVFLLIGTSRDQQLPTIQSRCQIIRFAPLGYDMMRELLQTQGVSDPAMIERLLKMSDGSPGRALALAEPELWSFRGELLDGLCTKPIHPVHLSKKWLQFVEKAGKETALQRRRAERVNQLLVEFLRDAITFAVGMAPRFDEPEEIKRLQTFAGRHPPEHLMDLIERCWQANVQIRRYIQPALIVEGLVDAFC